MRRSGGRARRAGPVACLVYTRAEPPSGVTRALFDLGYTVVERPFSPSFPELAHELKPDVAVAALDPLDPEDDAVLRALTTQVNGAALVVLAVRGEDGALAAAMEAGADAALPIGAEPRLLSAQIAALRRRLSATEPASRFEAGDVTIDVERRTAHYMGRPIDLTRSEFDILTFMARNAGRVLTPTEILAGIGQTVTSAEQARGMVKVHLSHLRRKLGQGGAAYCIATVRGVGYAFERGEAGPEQDDFRAGA